MTGFIRPPRGRQNKVTKPSTNASSSRRPGRQQALIAAATESAIHPALSNPAAAAAAAAAAAGAVADDGTGVAEAPHDEDDDDMVDAAADMDETAPGNAGVNQHHPGSLIGHTHAHMDVNTTAASILHAHAAATTTTSVGPPAGLLGHSAGTNEESDGEDDKSAYPAQPLSGTSHSVSYGAPPPPPLAVPGSILSSGGQQQQQQQHPQQEQQQQGGPPMKATEDLARECGYINVVVESALAKRLAREPGLRPATQRRPEQVLNLGRRSNVEALFAHIAGIEVASPCKNCHKGHGPWTTCVVVDGQMCGSCANCWFNASGSRCSFHETRNPQAQAQPAVHHHSNLVGSAPPVSGAPPSASEPATYPVSSPMPIAPQLAGVPLGGLGLNFAAAFPANDPTVGYVIDRAISEVRGADKRARDLMAVEIAAKQLALAIMKYNEDHGKDEPSGGAGSVGGSGEGVP